MTDYGLACLVPTICVLAIALVTHRTFEALLGGVLVGFVMLDPRNFFGNFTTALTDVMRGETVGWVILVCGLFGSLIHLLIKSGGASAFAAAMLRWVRSPRSALTVTWIMGLAIFIDDYLNALTIGSSMRSVTDRFKISREMLAYIVDSTAAPVCVLVPFSTWAIYVAGLMEANGLAPAKGGLEFYLRCIPYVFYGWTATLLVPMVIAGIVPLFGPMKRAELRAQGGEVVPPNTSGTTMDLPTEAEHAHPARLLHFMGPVAVLIAATIYFDVDALKGVLVALAFTAALMIATGRMTASSTMESAVSGFQSMLYPLAIIVMSFVLKDVNDRLGLTEFVIRTVTPWMNRQVLPALAFVTLSLATFSTGSFWGVYAIATPILAPLAQSLDVNPHLAMGALISAGAFGSHACFYGDATVLSSSASGCNNMAHAVTQFPYALLAAGVATALFLACGWSM